MKKTNIWARWKRDTRTLRRRLAKDGYQMLVNVVIKPTKISRGKTKKP